MVLWRVPLDSEEIQTTIGIVHILEDRCKGCGFCIEFCPRQVLEFSSGLIQKDTIHRRWSNPMVV